MAIDLSSLPAFGKCARDEAWARVRRSQATLNVSHWRIASAFALLAGLVVFLAMDAATLMITGGEASLWLLPKAGEAAVAALPGLAGPVLLMLPIGALVQLAVRLVKISLSEEPVVFIDYTGIAILSANGWQIFLWNEIADMKRWPGFVSMTRSRRGFTTAGLDTSVNSMRVIIPTVFLIGGEESFIDALSSVRPELARQVYGPNATEGPHRAQTQAQ